MSVLRRANESSQSDWRPVPEGVYRWVIGKPEIIDDMKYGKRVRFPLSLTEEERARLMAEHPVSKADGEGVQQSWRVSYRTGLSLGWVAKSGEYRSTRLVDFLAACFGQSNAKRFRRWIEQGGGPPRPADKDDAEAELALIEEWLGWWEDLQVLGAVSHHVADNGVTYANFGGPLPIGSLPGSKDDEYQAFGRGKLKAMAGEMQAAEQLAAAPPPPPPPPQPKTYQQVFGEEPVAAVPDDDDDEPL